MILGILLVCVTPVDVNSCVPVPNPNMLYPTMEACELEANTAAEGLSGQYYVRPFCFETNFFELL